MSLIVDRTFFYLLFAIPVISFLIVRGKVKGTTIGTKIFIFVLVSLFLFAALYLIFLLTNFWDGLF